MRTHWLVALIQSQVIAVLHQCDSVCVGVCECIMRKTLRFCQTFWHTNQTEQLKSKSKPSETKRNKTKKKFPFAGITSIRQIEASTVFISPPFFDRINSSIWIFVIYGFIFLSSDILIFLYCFVISHEFHLVATTATIIMIIIRITTAAAREKKGKGHRNYVILMKAFNGIHKLLSIAGFCIYNRCIWYCYRYTQKTISYVYMYFRCLSNWELKYV